MGRNIWEIYGVFEIAKHCVLPRFSFHFINVQWSKSLFGKVPCADLPLWDKSNRVLAS